MSKSSWVPDPMFSSRGYYDALQDSGAGSPDPAPVGTPGTLQATRPPRMSGSCEGPPLKRRGGLVDHRDVILAHQAHKIHSTPQARRKEWE
ncbi:unnamed protein product [Pipistrellus nathusii]|uniref:Uncharacterized protein n=1 Tax=Pipistrellus nathusii TaxID=59473 RepID=A0ABP0A627_PIPNA